MFEKNYMTLIGELKPGEKIPKQGTAVSHSDPYYALASLTLQYMLKEENTSLGSEGMTIADNYTEKLEKHLKKVKKAFLQELSNFDQ